MIDYICAELQAELQVGYKSARWWSKRFASCIYFPHMRISGSMFRKNKELEDIKCILKKNNKMVQGRQGYWQKLFC